MGLLSEQDLEGARERLQGMVDPVKLIHFTQELNVEYGRETRQLLEDLATASDKLSLEVYNVILDQEKASEYGVDKVPATIVRNEQDYGIRFYGLPAGYEFASLLDAILLVSRNNSGVSEEARKRLAEVDQPLHLEVFVTPTCPHCPRAVRLALAFAMENTRITADCIEATEFPDLTSLYGVTAVPKTVVNGEAFIDGALPEQDFLDRILESLQPEGPPA